MIELLLVFTGGGLGSLSRYGISKLIVTQQQNFPTATLVSNVLSCILLGVLLGIFLKSGLSTSHRLFLITGFCGGFSTFSSYSAETFILLQNGQVATALLYIASSVIVCLFCIWLGVQFSS